MNLFLNIWFYFSTSFNCIAWSALILSFLSLILGWALVQPSRASPFLLGAVLHPLVVLHYPFNNPLYQQYPSNSYQANLLIYNFEINSEIYQSDNISSVKGAVHRDGPWLKVLSIESCSLKGKAWRFSANFVRLPHISMWEHFKDSTLPRTVLGNWEPNCQ